MKIFRERNLKFQNFGFSSKIMKNTIFKILNLCRKKILLQLKLPYFFTTSSKIESKKYETPMEKVEKHVFMVKKRIFCFPVHFSFLGVPLPYITNTTTRKDYSWSIWLYFYIL